MIRLRVVFRSHRNFKGTMITKLSNDTNYITNLFPSCFLKNLPSSRFFMFFLFEGKTYSQMDQTERTGKTQSSQIIQ